MSELKEKRRKKRKKKGFMKFLISYSVVFVVFMVVTWVLLYGFIKDYEEGQPKHTIEAFVANFSKEYYKELIDKEKMDLNAFESKEQIADYLADDLDYANVIYKKKAGEFSEQTPVYEVVVGDKKVAKVTLTSDEENGHGFSIWKIGSIDVKDYFNVTGEGSYHIEAPSNATVIINGLHVGEEYVVERDITFEPCKNVGKYVDTPTLTAYEVSGFNCEPNIEAVMDGVDLTVRGEETNYIVSYPEDEELLAKEQAAIETLAQNYSLYLINKKSLETLNASMIGTAQEYVRDVPAIWAFPSGGTASFEDMKIWNCIRYSDDCFSVDISYNMKVTWTNGTPEANYDTHLNYTYVYRNGGWYLADFKTQNLSKS